MRRTEPYQKVDHELMRAVEHHRAGREHATAHALRNPGTDRRVLHLLVDRAGRILRIRFVWVAIFGRAHNVYRVVEWLNAENVKSEKSSGTIHDSNRCARLHLAAHSIS